MGYLAAAVVLVGLLCLLNLLLTFAVIRRLRVHTERLNHLLERGGGSGMGDTHVQAGEQAGEFTVVDHEGAELTRDGLGDGTLLGFFSPGCKPCEELLPVFTTYASTLDREKVVAVVDGADGKGALAYAERLAPVARVVVETMQGRPLQEAFAVDGFPLVFLVDAGGVVRTSDRSMRGIERASAHGA
ncbi:TlpA family protein disulfide reductase [Microtetraspora malaysiensis]|uniref:TlpA family protein disulfide reductase n=1 Tax=Microtetraspora malaysiensis TaxID=161358 RepID=UPI0008359049|nr:hypothetical protein [Microtetraspora malaysiensis]